MPATFNISKADDKSTFDRINKFSKTSGLAIQNVSLTYAGNQSLDLNSEQLKNVQSLTETLQERHTVIDAFSVRFDQQVSLTIKRHRTNPYDEASLAVEPLKDPPAALRLIHQAQNELAAIDPNQEIRGFLDDASQRYFDAQRATLDQLHKMAGGFFTDLRRYAQEQEQNVLARTNQLEDDFRKRKDELEAASDQRIQALTKKEQELAEREKQLDDRTNTHVRRELREKLKESLKNRSLTFHLTKDTDKLWWVTFGGFALLLLAFAGTAGYFLFFQGPLDVSGAVRWWVLARQITSTIVFAVTGIFFVRWSNYWYRQMAMEELSLKRLDLDIDRASWVVEMALEWSEEKDTPIPADLLDRMTRNLFIQSDARSADLHPAEMVSSAVLRALAGLSTDCPWAISQSGRHGWRSFQRTMLTAVVEKSEVQSQHRLVILPSFAEAVGQPSHSLDEIPHAPIMAFGVARANTIHVGDAQNGFLPG